MAEQSTPEDVEKAVDAIYKYAGALLREGKTRSEVEEALVAKGIERKTAGIVVDKLLHANAESAAAPPPVFDEAYARGLKKEDGARKMLIGGLLCLGGIVITALSYSAASDGGGRYFIFTGAIVYGAITFFRGLAQSAG